MVKTFNKEEIVFQINEAKKAARVAATQFFSEKMNNTDNFPCGFAWVKVVGIKLNSKVGKVFAEMGFRKSFSGGIDIWNPSGLNVQNVDTKEAGTEEFAAVLRKYGYTAYSGSRLD